MAEARMAGHRHCWVWVHLLAVSSTGAVMHFLSSSRSRSQSLPSSTHHNHSHFRSVLAVVNPLFLSCSSSSLSSWICFSLVSSNLLFSSSLGWTRPSSCLLISRFSIRPFRVSPLIRSSSALFLSTSRTTFFVLWIQNPSLIHMTASRPSTLLILWPLGTYHKPPQPPTTVTYDEGWSFLCDSHSHADESLLTTTWVTPNCVVCITARHTYHTFPTAAVNTISSSIAVWNWFVFHSHRPDSSTSLAQVSFAGPPKLHYTWCRNDGIDIW